MSQSGDSRPVVQATTATGTVLTVVERDTKTRRARITQKAKDEYVRLIAEEGLARDEAATRLKLTSTKFRAEAKRDPKFADALDDALRTYRDESLPERIRAVYHRRALGEDGPPALLHNLAVVHLPEFAIFQKIKLEGGDRPIDLRAVPTIDSSRYTAVELEALAALLEKGQRAALDP